MRMVRTTFALEEIRAYVGIASGNPLIESYFVQFLLVSFYSECEEVLSSIMERRLNVIEDIKVSSFISKTNDAMFRRVKKAEINDILKKFNCGTGDIISQYVGSLNLQPYFDAITNRHLVAHSEGVTMTLSSFADALPCAEAIFDAVEQALAA